MSRSALSRRPAFDRGLRVAQADQPHRGVADHARDQLPVTGQDRGQALPALAERGLDLGQARRGEDDAETARVPAPFPDPALQFPAPGDAGRVALAVQLGHPDHVVELPQLGQDRGGLRIGGRPDRRDTEGLRPRPFQPGKHQPRRTAFQGQPQARPGEVGAQGRGAGLQVQAAEPAPAGVHQGQAGPQFPQRPARPPFALRQFGAGQPAQQADVQRRGRPGPAHPGDSLPRLVGAPGGQQRADRDEFGHVRVAAQPAFTQPLAEQHGLGRDEPRVACRPGPGPEPE